MIVIVSILLVISIIDFKIKIIPNQLNVLLFISGIWSGFVFQEVTFLSRFLECFRLVFRCSYLQFYVQADWVEEMLS